ncbi:succinyl-CoA synthetase alpha subunit [Paraburkholderia sp. HC6.4b]|uniref:CoA-binding protein n=1 Tax=unclassified Paraburkholderia TaxID=2615204 RepID=UPI001616B652|nr:MULTISPECIES: CoA-binding protein [unclassified Paraburkholderia]MBB5412678.1 succinyl-CoA synthetase alpha subunit [Paraburkholderia sp. HC6.4b]MBB5454718.1 succinyl-CoA synthetase alpha subunit [Paraburkholderia sp. Kb1A]
MVKQGNNHFRYFVGIQSLAQIVTREDRVCVLNILGGESSDVTPVSHAFSGGNIVFGTAPGKRGQVLVTPAGDIPVYNNVREGLEAGHRFNCGVVYLPPSAARDGVAELIRVNPDLRKIFIITEKISVHDAREIRAMGQQAGIDIFGANGLGVADSWQRVRIGGALGGDDPGATLRRGSIAIFSNSGGFSTTIAQYLRMSGWGTTTVVSSGKDVYIHYAAPEFAFALANDARSKAAVLYCEPGGYYEADATFTKPVIACVVGRWKSRLTRAVGHAGAMAGGADDALAKERWFMEKFGVERLFTPDDPCCSAKGAVVTNIAHIPAALTAVMRANATMPDFEPEGSLSLKPWFGSDQGIELPDDLALPVVEAVAPYNEQITRANSQIGAIPPRQPLKDASGASQMDAKTQVSSLHGVSMLEAATRSLEENMCLALLREFGGANDTKLIDVAVGAAVNLHGTPELAAAQASREAGNAPNAVLAAAAAIVGPNRQRAAREAAALMIDGFATARLTDAFDETFDVNAVHTADTAALFCDEPDPEAQAMLGGLASRGVSSAIIRWLSCGPGHPRPEAVLAAITTTLAWGPLMRKRISRLTAESLPWWTKLFGTMIGASADASQHGPDGFCGFATEELLGERTLTEIAFAALLNLKPTVDDLFAFKTLVGLLLTNGPGAISAQGAKGAVSADGPESPERVQLNKALAGFLTHTGYTHGGNGYEGIAFLNEAFRSSGLEDPTDARHTVDLEALARRSVERYAQYKTRQKQLGSLDIAKLPGINHPVFKDKPVNHDPREVFIANLYEARGEYNAFHAFYRVLVQALFDAGVSRNVYCVNVDAVIAALLLKMLWQPLKRGEFSEADLETAAFTIFLYPRMLGCAAEIDDHLNRGRNMDTRTAASQCRFVA